MFIGKSAGYKNDSGIRNVAIGSNALSTGKGSNNTCVGANADVSEGCNNSIAIGLDAKATKSKQCVIGSSQIEEYVFGDKKILFNTDGTVTWEQIQV